MPEETKKSDDSAAAAAAAEEAEPADTEGAELEATEEADPAVTDEGTVVSRDSADEDFSASVSGDSEDEEAVQAPTPIGDEGIEIGELVDPGDLEKADWPINDIKIGNRSQFADRVVDSSSSVIPNDLQFVQGSALQGPARPNEDEERELLELRRGTLEPPDLSFGTGVGSAAGGPQLSRLDAARFGRLQEEPTEVDIGSGGDLGGPTEIPIDGGAPAEPPAGELPPAEPEEAPEPAPEEPPDQPA